MKSRIALASLVALTGLVGCKTADTSGADVKDVVTSGGLLIKHYYAEGEEARRALCPFGTNSEDAATYREKCNVSHTKSLSAFADKLEQAYRSKYKSGAALSAEEQEIGGLLVNSLSDPSVLKVKLNQTSGDSSEIIVSRMAGLFDVAIGADGGSSNDDDNGNDNGGDNGGDQPAPAQTIMTTSIFMPAGLTTTPLLQSQNPLKTAAVQVKTTCQGATPVGLQIAEGNFQPLLTLQGAGGGKFKTISGNKRTIAAVQVQFNNTVAQFCQVTVSTADAGGGGGGNDDDNGGDTGGGDTMLTFQFNVFGPGLVQPFSVTDLSPVQAKTVKAEITGCNAQVQGLQVSEGPGQIYGTLAAQGNGVFKSANPTGRLFYSIMVSAVSQGPGSCTLKLKKIN